MNGVILPGAGPPKVRLSHRRLAVKLISIINDKDKWRGKHPAFPARSLRAQKTAESTREQVISSRQNEQPEIGNVAPVEDQKIDIRRLTTALLCVKVSIMRTTRLFPCLFHTAPLIIISFQSPAAAPSSAKAWRGGAAEFGAYHIMR